MTEFTILLGGLVGQWMLGVAVATALLGKRLWETSGSPSRNKFADRAELIGLGIVFGIAATSYGQFLWALAGGRLGPMTSRGFAIAGFLSGGITWLMNRQTGSKVELNVKKSDSGAAWVRFAAVMIGLLFVSQLVQTVMTPQRLWDERAIFGLKAIVLAQDRILESPDLLHPDFVQYHPRYPLLIPLAEQHIYGLLGRVDDRWSKLVFPLMSLGLVLTFAGVLQRQIGPSRAWLWAVVLATVPVLAFDDYGFLSGQADAPVACFHGISLLYLWEWLRTKRQGAGIGARTLLVAGVSAAMTLFTKDEGIALFLVDAGMLVAVMGISAWKSGWSAEPIRSAGKGITIYVAMTVAVVIPWFLYRRHLPGTTEMTYGNRLTPEILIAGLGTLAWSIPHLLGRMFLQATALGLQWWGMLLAALSRFRTALRPEQLLLLGDVAGALAGLLVAGMIAPTPVEEHLGGSSHRFLMQLVPAAVLFMAGQWSGESRDAAASEE